MPEIIDPVFVKTSQHARFLLSENERFGLVFVKTGSINSGTDLDQHWKEKKNKSAKLITVTKCMLQNCSCKVFVLAYS